MAKVIAAAVVAALVLVSTSVSADDKNPGTAAPVMSAKMRALAVGFQRMSEVHAEHKQLKYFEGNWSHKSTVWLDPKASPQEGSGRSRVEAIHEGRYYQLTHEGEFNGRPYSSQGLIGFDNLKNEFVSLSSDSMSTGIWLAHGTYDAAKKTYTFQGEAPETTKAGASAKVRQVTRIVDENHYVFEWYETRGGKEAKTLQIEFSRQ